MSAANPKSPSRSQLKIKTFDAGSGDKASPKSQSLGSPSVKSFRLLEAPPADLPVKPYSGGSKQPSIGSPKRGSISGSVVSKPGSVASLAQSVRKSDAVRSLFTMSSGGDRQGSAPEVALRHIFRACKYYEDKVEGKDNDLGPGVRLVRELAKEVRREAQTLEQAQRDADAAQDTMGKVLESYVDVFHDPETLAQDLSLAFSPDQDIEDFSNVVLTPALMREAISSFAKRVVALQGDCQALQARWVRDLSKFEKSMQQSQERHADQLRTLQEEHAESLASKQAELRQAYKAGQEATSELGRTRGSVVQLERELLQQRQASVEREHRLLHRIEELEMKRRNAAGERRRAEASSHLRDIAVLQADILTAIRSKEEPLPC